MLESVVTGKMKKPRRVLLYGTHGIGKSTMAANSPNPIFLATEDGLDDIGVPRTPLISDFGTFNAWMSDLLTQDHNYKTIVVDSLDWLERLIWDAVAKKAGRSSIEDIGYGKGYNQALNGWSFTLKTLDQIRAAKNMGVIFLAHAKIAQFRSPDNDAYDRYEPDLHKSVSPLLQEWCDEVFFATYQVDVIRKDEGFGRERARPIGNGTRIMQTCETPTCLAKRRVQLPDILPLDWTEYAKHLANGSGNIAGVVKNGSSKSGVKSNG